MAEHPFVMFDRVHKRIGGQTIIREISLEVERGMTVALCGGNGAGKSTLLRMLAGVLKPTSGTIRIDGLEQRIDRLKYNRLFGYMPDDYNFTYPLSARETLRFWARLKGQDAARVEQLMEMVGLEHAGSKPVSAFSKGMRQRVLFAQAMLDDPPLIIMDEPTNGLDPYWIESFVRLVRQASASGKTVLFSTHMLHVAEALADRIVFLQGGQIIRQLDREQLAGLGPGGLHAAFGEWFGLASAAEQPPGDSF